MEDYFAAKASLFTPERARRGLVCVDDAWGRRLAGSAGVPVQTIATGDDAADWVSPPTSTAATRAAFRLTGPDGVDLALRSRLPGAFNVSNAAMAAAALVLLGEDPAAVGDAVLADPHVPGRMESVVVDGLAEQPRAVVDYAHTPDAVGAALRALRPHHPRAPRRRHRRRRRPRPRQASRHGRRRGRGRRPRRRHRRQPALGGPGGDPGGRPRRGRVGAGLGARGRRHEVGDRRQAIREAVAAAWPDGSEATVAVVGKGHETGQEVAGVVHPFDDRDELRAALRRAAEAVPR